MVALPDTLCRSARLCDPSRLHGAARERCLGHGRAPEEPGDASEPDRTVDEDREESEAHRRHAGEPAPRARCPACCLTYGTCRRAEKRIRPKKPSIGQQKKAAHRGMRRVRLRMRLPTQGFGKRVNLGISTSKIISKCFWPIRH